MSFTGFSSTSQAQEYVHSEQELLRYVKAHGAELDGSSKVFVDRAVREISQKWTLASLEKYAHPQLIAAKPRETWQKMFSMFSQKLGSLKSYIGSTGEAKIEVSPKGQLGFTARYVSVIIGQKGNAKVQIQLVRFNSTWYITHFMVYSDSFIE